MAESRILCGVAGSGKTHRVMHEVAQAASDNIKIYESSGEGITSTPLYIIVPEQHTLLVERQLLGILRTEFGTQAYTGLQVTSFTRLGRMLHGFKNEPPRQISDLGRQLIAWQLLDGRERQHARVNELSQMLAELTQYGVKTEENGVLLKCARLIADRAGNRKTEKGELDQGLPRKLVQLARQYQQYNSWCERLGLQVRDWALEINEESLQDAESSEQSTANTMLHFSNARIWLDGFMGFTPPELLAAQALISACQSTTITLLLDPELALSNPIEQDLHPQAEWYTPTLELFGAWNRISRDVGVSVEIECIESLPRRFAQPVLTTFSVGATDRDAVDKTKEDIRAFVCPTVRAEIDLVCHTILDLVQTRGWRFKDVCVVARDVKPFQELLMARMKDYYIPVHIDMCEGLGRHPLIEYIKCSLRLASQTAQLSDVSVLLNTGLLPYMGHQDHGGSIKRELLQRTEWLMYQRRFHSNKWLNPEAWEEKVNKQIKDGKEHDESFWQDAYKARIEVFASIAAIKKELPTHTGQKTELRDVLRLLWHYLLGEDVQHRIDENDWPVLEQIVQLWDEIALLGRGLIISSKQEDENYVTWLQFQQWLEFGLDQLSIRQTPLAADHVIVSGIEEGRVPPTKAVLIIGMSEDSWQPRVNTRRLFNDEERSVINHAWHDQDGRRGDLLASGDSAVAAREPYLALVAATRASQFMQFSYSALDRERKPRRPSRYFRWLTEIFNTAINDYAAMDSASELATVTNVNSKQDLALLAVSDTSSIAPDSILVLLPENTRKLLSWRRSNPANEVIQNPEFWHERVLHWLGIEGGLPRLVTNATQLETFAKCPFMYYCNHILGLNEPDSADIGNRQLGILYHEVLKRLLSPLAREDRKELSAGDSLLVPNWTQLEFQLPNIIDQAIAELELDEAIRRSEFLKHRCEVLLTYMLHESARLAANGQPRWPLSLEASFGRGQNVPAVLLSVDDFDIELRGKIDRIDLDSERKLVVIDYKLGRRKIDAWRISEGLELQLPVYLLALRNPIKLLEHQVSQTWPLAQSEYQPIEPYFDRGRVKLTPVKLPTVDMIKAATKSDGKLDAVDGLIGHTVSAITEYARQITNLQLTPRPVRSPDGKWHACQHCSFKPLCRFDPLNGGRYRQMAYRKMDTEMWREWFTKGISIISSNTFDEGKI